PWGSGNAIPVITEGIEDARIVRQRPERGGAAGGHADEAAPGMGGLDMGPAGEHFRETPLHVAAHSKTVPGLPGEIAAGAEEKAAIRQKAVVEEKIACVGAGRFGAP